MTRKTRSRGELKPFGKDKWFVRIFLGRGPDGKRQYQSRIVEGNRSKAQKYLTGKLREQDLGLFVENSRQTLNEHLDEWLALKKNSVRPQTYRSYELVLKAHARPKIGHKKLSEIKMHHVQELCDLMITQGLSARSTRYVHAVLSMAFRKAIEQNKILRNPCEFVDLPKQAREETKAMGPDQAKLFLKHAREVRHGLVLEFALVTGMRPEEYLALRWSDLDFDNGTARVRQALVWDSGSGFRFDRPKTQKSQRSVPLPPGLLARLRAHRKEQLEMRLKLGSAFSDLGLVFATDLGTPIHHRNLAQRSLSKGLKNAGLDNQGLVLYSLRHTCATLLLAAGENPKVVAERLGHTSVKMTLDTYSHVLPDMQRAATDRLGQVLYG